MKDLVKIFSDLRNDSSRTGKEKILKENSDNEQFREVLRFVYNPYIVTGISSKKINKKVNLKSDTFKKITSIDLMMKYLKTYNSGRDYDIYVAQFFINSLETPEEQELAKGIVTKSLKVGITEKTINNVYKGDIPTFGVMLAEPFEKHENRIKSEFYLTLKLDGNRCIATVEDDSVKFFSRKGQPIEGLVELEEQFKTLPNGVYDGEVLLINKMNLQSDELFRATQKIIRKDGVKKDLNFFIFDTLTLSEFKNGISNKKYSQRRNTLDTIIDEFVRNKSNIFILPVLYYGDDKNIIHKLMQYYVEPNNFEGLMLNSADGLYKIKRTSDLLKIKKMKSADLRVLSVEEGTGKYTGKLGRINVEYKGFIVGCGSGFSDEEREYYWNNKQEIIDSICEIQFFGESQDENGNLSLRFPVFRCVRTDKDESDIRYE